MTFDLYLGYFTRKRKFGFHISISLRNPIYPVVNVLIIVFSITIFAKKASVNRQFISNLRGRSLLAERRIKRRWDNDN